MRHIDRLTEPSILTKKHDLWQQQFDERRAQNPKVRPDSSKYGNPSIRQRLNDCSFNKCFYCESSLQGDLKEIDHFKEVALAPELAYTWSNLYLACHCCNDKLPHNDIPVEAVLDPCTDTDEEIQRHITFEDECICAQAGSDKGLETIRKFRLNSDVLDLKRARWLKVLMGKVIEMQQQMLRDGRKTLNDAEKRSLLRFVQPDQPYSLMSEQYLRKRFPALFV